MVAYADNEVFAQVWIGAEDKLPRMVRGVYRTDAAHLRHQVEFSNWQINTAVPADAFASTKTAGAKPIPFAHPNPKQPQGDKATAKGKPSKGN